jgi:serine O-acetyltransferase
MTHQQLNESLPKIIEELVGSLGGEPSLQHLNRVFLPNKDTIIEAIKRLRQIIFPGYFGEQGLTATNIAYRIGELVREASDMLYQQVRCCLRYSEQIPGANGDNERCAECDEKAADIVHQFLKRIPAVRQMLAADVTAAFESDPAAQSAEETIFSYPGLFAITVQRLAHEFYNLHVPLLPRIMTEQAHSETGIDIHPGAKLGRSFFIDHGTGVVIGETTEIGKNVKVYQGVTLGALAPAFGQLLRGHKRHPTIEDDVIIYAGATILGGDTVIGRGSIINGNVFLTNSVPPFTMVSNEPAKLTMRTRKGKQREAEKQAQRESQ